MSKQQIESIVEIPVPENLLKDLNNCLNRYKINTPQRIRHFVSQCCHESGGFQWFTEFASGEDYEGRSDLGNTTPGDGKKYKGAGAIQLTGRFNYMKLSHDLNDPKVISEGATYVAKYFPFTSAGAWWSWNGMNELCDRADVTVEDVTRRVNGGTNGLSDRIEYYKKASAAIQ